MILLCYQRQTGPTLGVKTPRGILSVAGAVAAVGALDVPDVPQDFYALGDQSLSSLRALMERLPDSDYLYATEEELALAPCVPRPGKILCVGLNYRGHAAETNSEIPAEPVLFSKFPNALSGSGASVALPSDLHRYDYEVELGVVIGKRARYVAVEEALDHVLGYCVSNDLSCRDLQFKSSQWLLGKTLDGFLPLGPYVVTADEVPDPQALALRTWVNGTLMQDSNTSDMVFSVAELISYFSRYMTLEAGDIIVTGTPPGVILGKPDGERDWLKAGDEVVCEVEGLGKLTTRLVSEEEDEEPPWDEF
jgi:2-keto-4-pentenoate hydratase/2-oxohepta-3-ene-1,7-dioic acid hydratase in catechol pathway